MPALRAALRFGLLMLLPWWMAASAAAQTIGSGYESFKPYFASLRSNEVNARVGPSKDHPITWVYHRQGLPVQVIDVHNEWRNIIDPEGDKGWVKKSLLSPRRTVITTADKNELRANPSPSATIIATVEKQVVCTVRVCSLHWCQVDAGVYRGWMEKASLWGILPAEIIE
jgi:SH3-like domain-containing protein